VEIVPIEDNLLIEAKVRPQDVAFLHPGQPAMVKFSAYDYTIYGGLKAKLELISADTVTDDKGNAFYLIQVRTEKNHLGGDNKPLLIIPGWWPRWISSPGRRVCWIICSSRCSRHGPRRCGKGDLHGTHEGG
jgi:hypothetical protein